MKEHAKICDACTHYQKQNKEIDRILAKHVHEEANHLPENKQLRENVLHAPVKMIEPGNRIIALSGQLLLNVKMGKPTDDLEKSLAALSLNKLNSELNTDDAKKTFWINIYNAFFQVLASRNKKTRPRIFKEKLIAIVGKKFSLDEIEHGILRKYRWKYSLGYFANPFTSKLIKQLSVSKIDFRIHFVLNCGAASCPPIASYKLDTLNQQLDMATLSFLTSETIMDADRKNATVTRLMQWFKADFGGTAGIKKIIGKYLNIDVGDYKISYSKYDWEAYLNNFS
ncbi:MAG: DUF547 domain-containing protein [Ferruginibacter sp.]